MTLHLKLLVDAASNAILGAPAIGGAGVDKRIDVLATAIPGGITGSAPRRREPAYAPQYGSAKDAINRPGDVADNLAAGTAESVPWHGLDSALGAGEVLVEVGSPAEFASGNIPGPRNVPLDDLRIRLGEPPARPLIVHGQVGQRGHTAALMLHQRGSAVRSHGGGYPTLTEKTSAVDRAEKYCENGRVA